MRRTDELQKRFLSSDKNSIVTLERHSLDTSVTSDLNRQWLGRLGKKKMTCSFNSLFVTSQINSLAVHVQCKFALVLVQCKITSVFILLWKTIYTCHLWCDYTVKKNRQMQDANDNVLDDWWVMGIFVVREVCLWKIEVTILIIISDGLNMVSTNN